MKDKYIYLVFSNTGTLLSKCINYYTKEAGVRELDREIATIIRKIVKDIVMNNAKDSCIINNGEYLW